VLVDQNEKQKSSAEISKKQAITGLFGLMRRSSLQAGRSYAACLGFHASWPYAAETHESFAVGKEWSAGEPFLSGHHFYARYGGGGDLLYR
jgi:hypothetical protein